MNDPIAASSPSSDLHSRSFNPVSQTSYTKTYFHVILAGVQGGGRFLTGLRAHVGTRGCVLPSLSTRYGQKSGEYRLNTHYKNLARQVVEQAHGKVIRIYAHSLGGFEVLDLMQMLALQPDLPRRSLEVFFISPPGVGKKGLRGALQVGKRFIKLIQSLGLYDQFHILPLENKLDTIVSQKRNLFLNEWLPRIVPEQNQRDQITRKLESIDAELDFIRQNPVLEQEFGKWYLTRRHQLMKGLLAKIIVGDHILEEIHSQYLHLYGENNEDRPKISRFARLSISTEFISHFLNHLFRGVDQKIIETFEYCQQMGINLKIGVVVLEKDELVNSQDYAELQKLAIARRIPIFKHIFENQEHSSVAYNWDLIDALEALVWHVDSSDKGTLQTA